MVEHGWVCECASVWVSWQGEMRGRGGEGRLWQESHPCPSHHSQHAFTAWFMNRLMFFSSRGDYYRPLIKTPAFAFLPPDQPSSVGSQIRLKPHELHQNRHKAGTLIYALIPGLCRGTDLRCLVFFFVTTVSPCWRQGGICNFHL